MLLCQQAIAVNANCRSVLWPGDSAIYQPATISSVTINGLQHTAKNYLNKSPHPVITLGSAGKITLDDPQLIDTREGIIDADRAAVLALAYYLTQQTEYLNKTKEILLAWANTNKPTGQPIDETRLEGMIWAYDLIACQLSASDNAIIKTWFETMRTKKRAWKFGPKTINNNHHIHQLKMLLFLDTILHDNKNTKNDIADLEKYSKININPQTGITVDYVERSALYYHNYVLQPWLEVSLISNCCKQSVNKAFQFLSNHILNEKIDDEFAHSNAKIDKKRSDAGFAYAKKDGMFDVIKATPNILIYYTLNTSIPNATLWAITNNAKSSPWLTFLKARRDLWHTQKPTS